ncbi:hypothetical protein ACWGKW_37130 [Streptomyces sp. NPDC054766]
MHEEQLLRDTVIGVYNVFEFTDEGAQRRAIGADGNSRPAATGHNYLYA